MQHNRRDAVKKMVLGSLALGTGSSLSSFALKNSNYSGDLKGNINHSVCWWTYNFISLDELCAIVKKLGFGAIDLVGPKDWPTLSKHGIYCSMCNGAEISLVKGWNDKQYHAQLIKNYSEHIELVSKAGYQNLICFSGNRDGMDDETGMKNCAEGLKKVIGLAEKKGVIIQIEVFNSKINHKDYMADKSAWAVELCKLIGSENFRILYDIYHMQINEGDVIRTIQDNHHYFGHYHTAGVPGRHEIDESQELYYPAIMKAILATGYKGYVAQEFIPTAKETKDKVAALKKAVQICDV
jgi:hydroxypyruvate isomerase